MTRLAALVAFTLFTRPAAAQMVRDVRMMPSPAGTIRLTVTVPAPALEAAKGTSGRMRLTLDGYEGVAPEGRPLLPERVVVVAVPASGEVSVSATAAGTEVTRDVRLVLAPLQVHRQRGEPEPGNWKP